MFQFLNSGKCACRIGLVFVFSLRNDKNYQIRYGTPSTLKGDFKRMILSEFADFLPLSLLVVYASIIFEAAKVKISENVLKPEVHMVTSLLQCHL